MARINLLPWREWEAERRQKEFLVNLVAMVAVAGMAVFLWGSMLDGESTTRISVTRRCPLRSRSRQKNRRDRELA